MKQKGKVAPLKFRRGQIALWMMTKFAMVFFIVLLAAIMVSFSQAQKESICKTQAQSMARNIAATLSNVINSPVEDERKVFALESSLSVGEQQLQRYWITITNVPSQKNDQTGGIIVHVLSASQCEGYAQAQYDRTMVVVDPNSLSSPWQPHYDLQVRPSDVQNRDYYLIIAKCQPKVAGYFNYLYVSNCHRPLGIQLNPDTDCPPYLESNSQTDFSSALQQNPLLQCCGWEALQTDPNTGVNSVTGGKPKCA